MRNRVGVGLRVACAIGVLASAACDPVNADVVSSLPPSNVRNGPLHRPGQPCLACHDGVIGDPSAFSVAGTIFTTPSETVGVNGASVWMTDSNGTTHQAKTNAAGNFYVSPSQWTPVYPIVAVKVTSIGDASAVMRSEIGRDGACGSCHTDPPGADSPGHIAMTADDGGALP